MIAKISNRLPRLDPRSEAGAPKHGRSCALQINFLIMICVNCELGSMIKLFEHELDN